MLVLTRKKGQRIRIGSNVGVTVLEVRGGSVKLGFDAPPGISIHREEICTRFEASGDMTTSGPVNLELQSEAEAAV